MTAELTEFDKTVIQEHMNKCTNENCEACADWRADGFEKNA